MKHIIFMTLILFGLATCSVQTFNTLTHFPYSEMFKTAWAVFFTIALATAVMAESAREDFIKLAFFSSCFCLDCLLLLWRLTLARRFTNCLFWALLALGGCLWCAVFYTSAFCMRSAVG